MVSMNAGAAGRFLVDDDRRTGEDRRRERRRRQDVPTALVLGEGQEDRRRVIERRSGIDRRWPFLTSDSPHRR